MKLSENVLLEIVEIVRVGLTEEKDVSDMLRSLDLVPDKKEGTTVADSLKLSDKYLAERGRVF